MTDPKEANAKSLEKTNSSSERKAGKKGRIRPRNYDLGNGVYRFSRTRMFHKKAIYKFLDKKTPKTVCYICIYFLLLSILVCNLYV